MCKKILSVSIMLLLMIFIISGLTAGTSELKPKTIGILIPMEHAALREIVAGFEKTVADHFKGAIVFKIQNAQGDIKLQRSIVELMVGQNVDMLVPIGTSMTQMTLSLVKKQPIVSLAALYLEEDKQKREPKNITGVLDEIGGRKKLEFIKVVLPELKRISLFYHGGNEKIFKEVQEIVDNGERYGFKIKAIMVQNLSDLEIAARTASSETDAFLVLKDHLIASGIRMLVSTAEKYHIPVMTADEGTIMDGAAIALGVRERQIGVQGGELAIKVLQGYPIEKLPMQEMRALAVFYNPLACAKQKIELSNLSQYAHENKYELIAIGP